MTNPALDDQRIYVIPEASLSDYTTFKLGGKCPYLIDTQTPQQLEITLRNLLKQKARFILIGGGSNLLVSDHGVDCVVVRYLSDHPSIQREGLDLVVSASSLMDQVCEYAAENGLAGLNCTNGIPGTVGGAVVGNAGAFGKQISDMIVSVTVLGKDGKRKKILKRDCGFGYRSSQFKKSDDIILFVHLALREGHKNRLLDERDEILSLRKEKHPDWSVSPCAGSFFRNIEPTSQTGQRQAAGWFLDQAGAKEFFVGGASVFQRHANIIIKEENGTAQDVFDLSRRMQGIVKEKYGLDLKREVRLVGNFDGKPQGIKETIW